MAIFERRKAPAFNLGRLFGRAATTFPVLLLFVMLLHTSIADAKGRPALTIVRPLPNETVRGTYAFVATSNPIASIATVEFALGSKRLGVAHTAPFRIQWNTAYASDGNFALQVIGRDSQGKILSTAGQVLSIDNHGNSLSVKEPDLSHTLTGVVRLSIMGNDHKYYPALWLVNLDGEAVNVAYTDNSGISANTVTVALDTTKYTNGEHELYIAMHSDTWPVDHPEHKSWHSWSAGFERVVNFDNGHVLMDISANYLHAYIGPGQVVVLGCRRLFTDGKSGPCLAPSYSSSDPRVVAVSALGSAKAGNQEGFAIISVADANKTTHVYVWVKKRPSIPHFAGGGRMSTSYRPGESFFVVAPFMLSARDMISQPTLLSQLQQAGINTLSEGFYLNPRNLRASYIDWVRYYNSNVAPEWNFARMHHFHVLAMGDEVCRNIGGEAWWTLNWLPAKAAVQYAMRRLAASGVAIGIDMVDEASMMWGSTPTPPGRIGTPKSFESVSCIEGKCRVRWPHNPVSSARFPSGTSFALTGSRVFALNTPRGHMFTATNIAADSFDFVAAGPVNGTFTETNDSGLTFLWWAGRIGGCPSEPCDPPVPNDALLRITGWLRSTKPRVPISWPPLGQSPASVQSTWMGPNSMSDYASDYWVSLNTAHTYTWSVGIQEWNYWMRQAYYERQPVLMLDRPQLLLDSVSGPFYTKETEGASYYSPVKDDLGQPGVSGAAIISSMMTAAALGAAGVRLYFFENAAELSGHATAKLGTTLQTGVNPTSTDPLVRENWRAISYAGNALKILTPYLFGATLNSPAYGRNIVTAARQGNNGRMLMIINDNDWARAIRIDLSPYSYRKSIVRYNISYDGIRKTAMTDSIDETITLGPGESAVYLFTRANG
jgi:hypothetical protein